jgi:hypothetical protein
MPSTVDKIKLNRKQDRRARFTDEEVNEMRELYAKGWTQKVIAEHYGTHQSTVGYIVSEKAHKHLAEYRKVNPPKRRTKEEAKVYMRDLRKYKRDLMKGGE